MVFFFVANLEPYMTHGAFRGHDSAWFFSVPLLALAIWRKRTEASCCLGTESYCAS